MANSFIRVPQGYEGPSEFQLKSQEEFNKEAGKYLKVNIQSGGLTYDALEPYRPLEGFLPPGRPTARIQPRVPRPTSHIRPSTPDPGYVLPSISSLVSPLIGPFNKNFTGRADSSKAPTNTDSTYQPASSLLRRQSDSDDEYGGDSELEEDLALMRVSSRRPAGGNLESSRNVKEALDVLERSNAEKTSVEDIRSGKYPRLTLPTRNKVARSDAKDKTVKTGGDGGKKTNKSIQATLERAVETHTRVLIPSQAKLPPHGRVVIPITDEEAAEENPKESLTEV